jgi:hypothetical protein
MLWTALNVLALLGAANAQTAHMMRFACSKLVVERLDPLVNPGLIGTPHVHQIVGGKWKDLSPKLALDQASDQSAGNSFKADMKPVEYDLPTESTPTFPQ